MMLEIEGLAKQKYIPPEPTVITIGGYDNGALWIGQVNLVPTKINGIVARFDPEPAHPVLQKVDKTLVYGVAGYDSEVRSILDNPSSIPDKDPTFAKYSKSMAADSGASLTLNDLKTLAKELETVPAAKHPIEVGGDQQLAVLTNGKISSFDSPPANSLNSLGLKTSALLATTYESTYTGGGQNMEPHTPGVVNFDFGDRFKKLVFKLDDMAVLNSTFSGCTLFYNGSPVFLFDNSNVLVDTDLQLGPNVPADLPVVKEFERMYPNVPVIPWPKGATSQKTRSGVTIIIQAQ